MGLMEENWDKTKFVTNQDIVNEFAKHKPKASFLPNEMFEYSNTGYALLGLIIEKVSNQSFGDFLKENIFTPLKMENTFIYRSRFKPEKVENYALGYVSDSLGNKVLLDSFGKDFYTYYLDGIVGDGMVNSTAKDLLKWDRALYTDKLVSAKDKELIFSSIKTEDGEDSNYGFGWSISESTKYGKIASHSGSWAGYITFIERDLDNDKTIIILQNNDTNLTSIPIKNTRKIVYNESIEVELINRVELTEEDLEKYLGVYSNSEFPLKLTISKMKNQLMAQATGQSAFPLESYENHTFKFDPAQIKMIFNLDKKIMEFTQGANKITFSKE
jgi:CubicO group peptidase (beta-lactamase class C family)